MRCLVLALLLACHHYEPAEGKHVESHAAAIGAAMPVLQGVDASNKPVALADLVRAHDRTVIVFYRGFY
jgi:hypothetical protein